MELTLAALEYVYAGFFNQECRFLEFMRFMTRAGANIEYPRTMSPMNHGVLKLPYLSPGAGSRDTWKDPHSVHYAMLLVSKGTRSATARNHSVRLHKAPSRSGLGPAWLPPLARLSPSNAL